MFTSRSWQLQLDEADLSDCQAQLQVPGMIHYLFLAVIPPDHSHSLLADDVQSVLELVPALLFTPHVEETLSVCWFSSRIMAFTFAFTDFVWLMESLASHLFILCGRCRDHRLDHHKQRSEPITWFVFYLYEKLPYLDEGGVITQGHCGGNLSIKKAAVP